MNQNSVEASHILIKHNKSRTPLDRLRNIPITRDIQEAKNIVSTIRQLLVVGGMHHFTNLAQIYSECGSATEGGSLGSFSKGDMQPAFEEVAFKLNKGELSDIVSTDSGIHIIMRN